ncbi:hypothetical protein [Sphingomonas sp. 3-13AW]|uniref:hypothetical protein n=1 Tax=Sphingomonas sp. 3-13AW TaxID=3050450 RepID=UPI003BB491DF
MDQVMNHGNHSRLSERARALLSYIGETKGDFEPFGPGYPLLCEWIREEVLCKPHRYLSQADVDTVAKLLGEDFPLAHDIEELRSAAMCLALVAEGEGEASISVSLGDWYITWQRSVERNFEKRMVLIDQNRRVPGAMRHWFERAGIYQSKGFGMHRAWRRHNYIDGSSRRTKLTAGTADGRRRFRVLPHIARMDICDGYFDRWANSLAASVPMPRTQAEFDAAIERLLELSAKRVDMIRTEVQHDAC